MAELGYWRLADVIGRLANVGKSPSASTATVQGTDSDGVTWVVPTGSDEAVPVNGTVTVEAEPGSTVVVTTEGGRLSMTGNSTAPAIGVSQAQAIVQPVEAAVAEAQRTAERGVDGSKAAQRAADAANAVANATNQHFWADDAGVHVTQEAQEDFATEGSDGYQSGANVLLNSAGQLFRDGLNNLLALVTGDSPGAVIYDGAGNAASNIAAMFTKALARLGYAASSHVDVTNTGVRQYVGSTLRSALTEDGLDVYAEDGETSVASFGEVVRVGAEASSHVAVGSDGISLRRDATTLLARFFPSGWQQYVGGVVRMYLSPSNLNVYDAEGTNVAQLGAALRVGATDGQHMTVSKTAGIRLYDSNADEKLRMSVEDYAPVIRSDDILMLQRRQGSHVVAEMALHRNGAYLCAYGTREGAVASGIDLADDGTVTLTGALAALDHDVADLALSNTGAGWATLVSNAACATVHVRGVALASALASGASVAVATVPDGLRPAEAAVAQCATTPAGAPAGVFLSIGTTGVVTVNNRGGASLATTYALHATITYVI